MKTMIRCVWTLLALASTASHAFVIPTKLTTTSARRCPMRIDMFDNLGDFFKNMFEPDNSNTNESKGATTTTTPPRTTAKEAHVENKKEKKEEDKAANVPHVIAALETQQEELHQVPQHRQEEADHVGQAKRQTLSDADCSSQIAAETPAAAATATGDPAPSAASPATTATTTSTIRYEGSVIWFNAAKGYGFIATADPTLAPENLFVHYTAIQLPNPPLSQQQQKVDDDSGSGESRRRRPFRKLAPNENVTFEIVNDSSSGRSYAANVQKIVEEDAKAE